MKWSGSDALNHRKWREFHFKIRRSFWRLKTENNCSACVSLTDLSSYIVGAITTVRHAIAAASHHSTIMTVHFNCRQKCMSLYCCGTHICASVCHAIPCDGGIEKCIAIVFNVKIRDTYGIIFKWMWRNKHEKSKQFWHTIEWECVIHARQHSSRNIQRVRRVCDIEMKHSAFDKWYICLKFRKKTSGKIIQIVKFVEKSLFGIEMRTESNYNDNFSFVFFRCNFTKNKQNW